MSLFVQPLSTLVSNQVKMHPNPLSLPLELHHSLQLKSINHHFLDSPHSAASGTRAVLQKSLLSTYSAQLEESRAFSVLFHTIDSPHDDLQGHLDRHFVGNLSLGPEAKHTAVSQL